MWIVIKLLNKQDGEARFNKLEINSGTFEMSIVHTNIYV